MEQKKRKSKVTRSEPDIAFQILQQRKQPMHYKDLLIAIWEELGLGSEPPGSKLAQLHTEINLDGRFVPLGKGVWGLSSWAPKSAKAAAAAPGPTERNYQPKVTDYLWDEDASEDQEDDESELLVPDDEEEALDDLDLEIEEAGELGDDEEEEEEPEH